MSAIRDLDTLLRSMRPSRRAGSFVFVTGCSDDDVQVHAMVVEAEGTTLVVAKEDADARGWRYDFEAAWITLEVHSALDAVGLTAAVSTQLAAAHVSANIIAGYFHDHVLVPAAQVDVALAALTELSRDSRIH